LPDWRIEKSALTALNHGHQVAFGGTYSPNYNRRVFSDLYVIDWHFATRFGVPFFWNSVKKQVEHVIREVKPDIVHAHNIFSAKMVSQLGLPFIYDDHEYWSYYAKALAEYTFPYNDSVELANKNISRVGKLVRKAAWNLVLRHRAIKLWTKWEKDLVCSVPTIVTTDKVAEEFKVVDNNNNNNSNRVFVVPNFPMKWEVKDLKSPIFHDTLSSVYAGKDKLSDKTRPHRNMDGLTDIFKDNNVGCLTMIGVEGESSANTKFLGFLSREAMYDEMYKHSIGLIPFKPHWLHPYRDSNKAYEYAHAGLFVMTVSSLESVVKHFKGTCATFESYNDMISQLKYFNDNLEELYNKRLNIFELARNELVWEKYEKNILCAYQYA
jgi:hypothetical protein